MRKRSWTLCVAVVCAEPNPVDLVQPKATKGRRPLWAGLSRRPDGRGPGYFLSVRSVSRAKVVDNRSLILFHSLSTHLPEQVRSRFVPFGLCPLSWLGLGSLSCVCEGGLLRKPPLKRAGTNSARNYIFMRDTSLRQLRFASRCTRTFGLRAGTYSARNYPFMRDLRARQV